MWKEARMILHLCWPCTARVGTATCVYVMCGKIHKTCQFAKFGSLAKITSVRKSITNMFWQTFTRKMYSCHFIKKPETQMHSQKKKTLGSTHINAGPKWKFLVYILLGELQKLACRALLWYSIGNLATAWKTLFMHTRGLWKRLLLHVTKKNIKYNSGKCKKSHTLSLKKTQV